MSLRDRVVEFRRVPASELIPDPMNPRKHPVHQRRALKAAIEEIGFAGAALVRRGEDGKLYLIDGHLRQEELGAEEIPTIITDLDADEARKLMLTYDQIGGLAEIDPDLYRANLQQVAFKSLELQNLAQSFSVSRIPNFQPVGIEEQGRLDQKKPITCPECGHEFTT